MGLGEVKGKVMLSTGNRRLHVIVGQVCQYLVLSDEIYFFYFHNLGGTADYILRPIYQDGVFLFYKYF